MSMPPPLFDRRTVKQGRERAVQYQKTHAFLFNWTIREITARLEEIKRDFPLTLQIGTRHDPALSDNLKQQGGIETLLTMDLVRDLSPTLIADEEALPFCENAFDAVLSPLSLHSVSDLPGTLVQINRVLKPDGLFLGALFGGETLPELRHCLMQAELSLTGGASPRIAPFATKQQMGELLQRAGFALPLVDCEKLTVTYDDAFALMRDLRFMGESNFVANRNKSYAGHALFAETARLYQEEFAESDGRIPATFEIIFLIGWAPHDSQPQPLCPGSATVSLTEILEDKPC